MKPCAERPVHLLQPVTGGPGAPSHGYGQDPQPKNEFRSRLRVAMGEGVRAIHSHTSRYLHFAVFEQHRR